MKKVVSIGLFIIFFAQVSFAQFSLRGKILDENQLPLTGANILLENTFQGVSSDQDGNFMLNHLKSGEYDLKISFIGYKDYLQKVQVADNMTLQIQMEKNILLADEIIVSSTRFTEATDGVANVKTIGKEELQKQNLGQDMPFLLNFTPSVVSSSDAGAGIGYTNIRIRGSDATRINVSINGIPYNDTESQGVFWVNMPDFASSVNSIQIQRGVGSSTNGAGAFGASINIQTNSLREKAYAEINNSYGSFNTWKHTLMAGSGLLNGKFTLDMRLSKITSDGFIDRAKSDLKSYFVSGAYYGKRNIFKINIFSGQEKTFQAWNGVPESRLRNDVQGMNDYILRNGLNANAADLLLNSSNRTYNSYDYTNQTDNYQQDHYQFFYTQEISSKWNANIALHYTKGKGYYEEYKDNQAFEDYKLANLIVGTDTITSSNLIRRRWLDNDFYGVVYAVNYEGNRLNFSLGGALNQYKGRHFGEVIWSEFASNGTINQKYYENEALKTDFNIYSKLLYRFGSKLTGYLDLQYRTVGYSFLGVANDNFGIREIQQSAKLDFFNPKIGFNYQFNPNHLLYASLSIGNKEPNRDDFTQSTLGSRPKAETMQDLEAGYTFKSKAFALSVNYFWMNYQNQLIPTGKVNDVGNYTRVNIPKSYRTGLELEIGLKPAKKISWNLNATWSMNKVIDFREFIDDYDTGIQLEKNYSASNIAFSPEWIGASQLEYSPFKNFGIAVLSKYVGEQYMDNTSNADRKLNAFFTNDVRLNYRLQTSWMKDLNISLLVNNITNERYESNGYTYSYFSGGNLTTENFYYPQAGTNFLCSVGLKF